MQFIKWYFWFIKESIPFCKPQPAIVTIWKSIFEGRASWFTKEQIKWCKMTPEQRTAWYESGEGRMI